MQACVGAWGPAPSRPGRGVSRALFARDAAHSGPPGSCSSRRSVPVCLCTCPGGEAARLGVRVAIIHQWKEKG